MKCSHRKSIECKNLFCESTHLNWIHLFHSRTTLELVCPAGASHCPFRLKCHARSKVLIPIDRELHPFSTSCFHSIHFCTPHHPRMSVDRRSFSWKLTAWKSVHHCFSLLFIIKVKANSNDFKANTSILNCLSFNFQCLNFLTVWLKPEQTIILPECRDWAEFFQWSCTGVKQQFPGQTPWFHDPHLHAALLKFWALFN